MTKMTAGHLEAWRQSGTLVVLFETEADLNAAVADGLCVDNWKHRGPMEIEGKQYFGATPTEKGNRLAVHIATQIEGADDE